MCKEYFEALHQYFYRAKVIIYTSLLVIVVASSLIRSQFPDLHPPWQVLRWAATIVLLGILFVPPVITIVRRRRKAKLAKNEWHG